MKKIFSCTMLFLICFFFIGCDSIPQEQIETVLDSLENAEIGKVYEGTYDQFKNINVESSYLGYGYDIINDEYIKKDCINLSAPIIDLDKLDEVKLKLIKENNAETIEVEADTMEDFVEKYSVATKVNGKAGVLFSGGLSVDYKSDSEVKTYTHYFKKILDVKTFNLYLTNSLSEIKNLLTEEFKDDLMNLHPESLFDKYGTHMLKEVSMGGRIEVSSQYSSVKSGASASVEAAVDAHVNQLKGGEVNAELLTTAEANLQKENIQYYYNVKQIGGALTNINSISSLNDKYDEWLKSFDNNAEYSALSGIVGENSLIALWDLLPAEETARREELYEAFKQLSGDAFDKLCEDFKINTKRTLNVAIDGPGTIDSYDYKYEDGDEVILKATPNENARFIGWYSGDQYIDDNATYIFNIHVNTKLVAKFQELTDDSFRLIVNISGQGEVYAAINGQEEVKVNNGQLYKEGDQVTLIAKPYYGNSFVEWYVNNEPVSSDIYNLTIKENTTIVAKFTENKIEKYQLIVNKSGRGNGTVEYDSEYKYNPDEVAVVKAIPDEYSYFVGWFKNDVLISTSPEYKFFINENIILYAKFEIIQEEEYTVTFVVNPKTGGKAQTSNNKTSFKFNDIVTLVAEANEGYEFSSFEIDDDTIITENNYSFIITKNTIVRVNFSEKVTPDYTLTYNLNTSEFKVKAQIEEENLILSNDSYYHIYKFAIPTSTYLIFKGWYIEDVQISDEKGEAIRNVENYINNKGNWIGGNATIYAKWEYNQNYIFISTPTEFDRIRSNSAGKFVLLENIDFSNSSISPIDDFSGVLDGNGKTISNWKYVQDRNGNLGLFNINSGTIKNLVIEKCAITTVSHSATGVLCSGLLCGLNNGTIQNVSIKGCSIDVTLGSVFIDTMSAIHVGIACGINRGIIKKCSVYDGCHIKANAATDCKQALVYAGIITGTLQNGKLEDVLSRNNYIDAKARSNWESKKNFWGKEVCEDHGTLRCFIGGIAGWTTDSEMTRTLGYKNDLKTSFERECSCTGNITNQLGSLAGQTDTTTYNLCYSEKNDILFGDIGSGSATGAIKINKENMSLDDLPYDFKNNMWIEQDGLIYIKNEE